MISCLATPIALLVLLPGVLPAGAARARNTMPSTCRAGRQQVIAADSQAQIYQTRRGESLTYHGCVFGKSRSFVLGGPIVCGGGGTATCGGAARFVLAGTIAAYEETSVEEKYGQPPQDEWMVVVRDLRTGRTLHRLPTGSALQSQPGYVGVGHIVALVLKGDGAAAWVEPGWDRRRR